MLKYDRNDMSEEIDVNKTNSSCECINFHYWYFLGTNFRFQSKVCDGCHNLMKKVANCNDIAIVSVKGNDYRNHFCIRVKMKP